MTLSNRRCRILCAVFAQPTRSDVRWPDFVSLLLALGGSEVKSGKTAGSRRRLELRGIRAVLHKPHPGSQMNKGSLESARQFLQNAGATPVKEGCRC
ncbi:MAG TPA: type II toxin-antitoxin system HicA family toxin [Alphaproteobacteria bacterium]|nr:type II toxin-antitoxin system HicA family toxin [Alphaproteobacteria bacterium]